MEEATIHEPTNSTFQLRLLVGLGNPGREYERTRHNIGFMILDQLARRGSIGFTHQSAWRADIALCGGVRLCKPQSFMNLSGEPTAAVSRFYKIDPSEVLVVFDDAALPLGKLRLRASGSAGGHNGMQSIIDQLGTTEIPRLRVGIGAAAGAMTGHVLGRFSSEEEPLVAATVSRATDALEFAQTNGLAAAMNQFNQPPTTPSL